MPSDYARRGRPRGSGLDDRVQLRRIAELIEADPGLRPTTAIKALGVSDPSTIRRLRDKLKTEMRGAPQGAHSGGCRIGSAEMLEARRQAVPAQRGTNLGSAASGGLAQVVPATMSEAQLSWFTRWCAFGLYAVSSTAEAQRAMMDEFFRVPEVASALREQIRLNEVAKAFCPKRSEIRTTLH
ncbi:hypothetical protein [Hyphomicrobium sp. CS1GBMeth3]|uniref:hypothetical protein n=1 Tax=Hyphomicrobium sp. CS1GBMeth3 TaxID=1892845 RepID=UPI000A7F13AC|nr:hypothetical protein [Hyphomicrobium sp. CS1GBMeth3]